MRKLMIAPSVGCCDLFHIEEQVKLINEKSDYLHMDIKDGVYVPSYGIGPDYLDYLNKHVDNLKPMDAHLMVKHPQQYLELFARSGAEYITPHTDCIEGDAFVTINKIKELGCKAGVALSPLVPLSTIEYYLPLLDKVTIMIVDPGISGQPVNPQMFVKIIKSESLNTYDWYRTTLYNLVSVCRTVSSKYTRSKIRKALPDSFKYVIEELITEKKEVLNKTAYYEEIINTIIEIGYADKFIEEMSNLIQRLVIDHLHIIGDIYDRGSGSHFVMESLCNYHSLDIQWGNHDVLWMGASAGQTACIANIVRTSLLYDNVSVLENGYGISILPLMLFAMKTYGDDPCTQFKIRSKNSDASEIGLKMKAHKAISIIQFKLEGQLISEHPEYKMEQRKLLHKIDFANKTIELDGKKYPLTDSNFPTVNPDCPYELTEDEKEVVRKLRYAFVSCEKLKKHICLLLNKGSLYKVTNSNLLFHGCIPMTADGGFRKTDILGNSLCGKALYDRLESCARKAFLSVNEVERKNGRDILWYLWNGADSPLYGRDKMTTFERYFIADESTHVETKDIYYTLIDSRDTAEKIFDEFSVKGENRHIINGHVPIHHQEGENPVKCGGRVIIIDGGFSRPYHKVTGIAGYTLIYNSYGLMLTAHEPFRSVGEAIKDCTDMQTHRVASEVADRRILVGDTDNGAKIKETIGDLKELINAYRSGEVRQNKDR